MPYTTPATFVAGDVLTAAQMNTQVRDNTAFLANPPACVAYRTANQAIGAGAFTAVLLDLEAFDTDTMHSTSTNTSRLTINTAGVYHVWGQVSYACGNTGERFTVVRKNGVDPVPSFHDRRSANTTAGGESVSVSLILKLVATDYLEVFGYSTIAGGMIGGLGAVWRGLG